MYETGRFHNIWSNGIHYLLNLLFYSDNIDDALFISVESSMLEKFLICEY